MPSSEASSRNRASTSRHARPYATGVDALNALQAGETDMVQAGVPSIGAILRGMDLVFFGNFSGNATKLGSDATLALIADACRR